MSFWDNLLNGPGKTGGAVEGGGMMFGTKADDSNQTRWANGLGMFGSALQDIRAAIYGGQGGHAQQWMANRQNQFKQAGVDQAAAALQSAILSGDQKAIQAAAMGYQTAAGQGGLGAMDQAMSFGQPHNQVVGGALVQTPAWGGGDPKVLYQTPQKTPDWMNPQYQDWEIRKIRERQKANAGRAGGGDKKPWGMY